MLPLLLLLSLLAVQCLVFIFSVWPPKLQGDEKYYVQSASQFLEGGNSESSQSLQKHKWRTRAYPLFIALCNTANETSGNLRYRCALVQLVLAICGILCLYYVASLILGSSPRLYLIAFLLGIQPWSLDLSRKLYPDSLTASLLTMGLLGLFAFIRAGKTISACCLFILSAVLLSATVFLRPEMIVIVPVFVLIAFHFKLLKKTIPLSVTIICSVLLVASAGLLSGDRLNSKEEIGVFGKYSLEKPGALSWVQTWFATERTAIKNFLDGRFLNRVKFELLPDRAFADEQERTEIRKACELSEQRTKYDEDVDRIFREVAEKRKREHFFRHSVATRIWGMAHLWLNLEASEQWFQLLPKDSFLFVALVLCFVSLKLMVFALAVLSVLQIFRYRRNGELRWYHSLTILMILCVVARTLLMGGMIGYLHRYTLAAWPAMLWCAVSACIDFRNVQE